MQKNKLGAAARIIVASALILTGAGVSPALAQGTAVPPSPISVESTESAVPIGETENSESLSLPPVDPLNTAKTLRDAAAEKSAESSSSTVVSSEQEPAEDSTPDKPASITEPEKASTSSAPVPKEEKREASPRAADVPTSSLAVTKTNSLGGDPVKPGESFTYSLSANCESLTTDCVATTLTDILPAEFEVTSLPKSTNDYDVTFDEKTRELKIVFKQNLQNPAGETGLKAGSTFNVEVGMRLNADSDAKDGVTVPNELVGTSENTPDDKDTSDVVIEVPAIVKPEATKSWPGSAVAGMDDESTISLGVSNSSSSTAEVNGLELTEENEDVFNYFNFTGATVKAFPEGADRAELRVKLSDGSWVVANTINGPAAGKLILPAGVNAEDVVGVKVIFANKDGKVLPSSTSAGVLDIDVQARDFERGNNNEVLPEKTITVKNCAQVVANDKQQGLIKGKDACEDFDIFPSDLKLEAAKSFYADSNGNFKTDNGEHAVIGENSGVSIGLTVKNASDFPVKELVIYEPGATEGKLSEFEKFDAKKFKVEYPAGATTGVVEVTFADGTSESYEVKNGEIVDLPAAPRATGLKLTFTGVDNDGNPSIAAGSSAGFHIHGNLNEKANEEDLNGGTSPQIANCAHFTGTAGRVNGTGSAAADVCTNLELEDVDGKGEGVKNVGQTSVPEGQPIPFNMTFTNNGNVPLNGVTITDPRFDAEGKPLAPNPFDQLRITKASVSGVDVGAIIELYIPGNAPEWIAFDGATADQLEAARGIRATLPGSLPAKQRFSLHIVTERRDGVGENIKILNCFDAAGTDPNAENVAVTNKCAPAITTGPQDAGAGIEKVIAPKTIPEFIPGMDAPTASVKLSISNEGNLSAKRLVLEDKDEDFFNAFDFNGFTTLKFPVGANRVQIDAYVDGAWVLGEASDKAALPENVTNEQVRGIRATFSSTNTDNDGFVLTPCGKISEDDNRANCRGELEFSVKLLEQLREPVGENGSTVGTHENTLDGGYQTIIQGEGPEDLDPVDPTTEDITVEPGDSSMNVEKTPNTTIAPGQKAPFNLKVTNTGNSNLKNIEIIDQLDAHMQLNEEFDGDGVEGHPYKVTFGNLPQGAAEPPQPTFTPVRDGNGKITDITWDFGNEWVLPPNAWVSLEIEVMLAAGVQAGDKVPNKMGSTVGNDDFTCTDPTGLNTGTSEAIGDKTYCTDTAELTTAAGAAFDSRKWVAGNPELGWYHTWSGETLSPGDATCPSTKDNDGVFYTAYPCIALVNPGDTYKYMLRIVNAGTEPAKQMRIIDQFPVEGDTGVHVNEDRGTEWNNRPVLHSVPKLTYKSEGGKATAELTNLYTNQPVYDQVCTKDLDLTAGAEQCAESDWNAAFSAEVTATQFRVAFDKAMQPGDTAQINFEMKTPLEVDQVNNPTIAWNSFAHAETTIRENGKEHVMPPTEPIKVGVGVSYGRLQLVKTIGENPGNVPVENQRFPFQVTCTTQPVGAEAPLTVWDQIHLVSSVRPGYITSLPAGASCEIYEIDASGGTSSAPKEKPIKVKIDSALGQDPAEAPVFQVAEITNDFPLASLSIEKKLEGNAAGFAPKDYEVSLTCTFNAKPLADFTNKALTVTAGQKLVLTDVPAGSECVMSETNSHGATGITWDPAGEVPNTSAPIKIVKDTEAAVSVTNTFNGGTLAIHKSTVGSGADEDFATGAFEFSLVCTFEGNRLDLGENSTISLTGDASKESLISEKVGPLPAGTECVVSETNDGGADETPSPLTVTIVEGQDKVAAFTEANSNKFSSGTIALTKNLAGAAAGEAWATDATFDVLVTCQVPLPEGSTPALGDVLSQKLSIKGGETTILSDEAGNVVELPVGAHCFGEELVTGGATSHAVDFDSYENAAIVTAQEDPSAVQELKITATNTFEYGKLALNKIVDGEAASFVGDREFDLALTCSLPNGTDKPTELASHTVKIKGGEISVIEKLPIGAECFATETNKGGASNVEISNPDASKPAVVTAADDKPVTITATNTFDAGQLSVKKHVVDGPLIGDIKYGFSAVCSTEQGEVVLPEGDSYFELAANEEKVISVPTGAECQITEDEQIGNIDTSVLDSDGTNDGKVTVVDEASVNVTNTYLWGDLELVKNVIGDAANYVGDREFVLDVSCRVPWIGEEGALLLDREPVTVTAEEVAVLEGLPQGTECWAVESDTGGATSSAVDFDSAESHVVIGDGTTVAITATNTFDAAQLTVKKTVVNGKPGPYDFSLTCSNEFGQVPLAKEDASFKLKHGEQKVVSVPLGAECKVEESTVEGAKVSFVEAGGSNDGTAIVAEDSVIEVVNTFELPTVPTDPTEPTEPTVPAEPTEPGSEVEKPELPVTGLQSLWLGLGGFMAVGVGFFLLRRRRA